MSEEAPLLNDEADHPHDIVFSKSERRVVAMDSARYVDARIATATSSCLHRIWEFSRLD